MTGHHLLGSFIRGLVRANYPQMAELFKWIAYNLWKKTKEIHWTETQNPEGFVDFGSPIWNIEDWWNMKDWTLIFIAKLMPYVDKRSWYPFSDFNNRKLKLKIDSMIWRTNSYQRWCRSLGQNLSNCIPSGKLRVRYGKSPFFIGKSPISMGHVQ